jgi:hypothetical protein
MRILAVLAAAFFTSLIAACGGGGGGTSPVPDTGTPGAQAFRFEVHYDSSTTPPGASTPGRYITVRSLAGNTSLGTRPTSKVEITFDQEAPRSLAAPSFTDAQGRANYLFPVSSSYTTSGPVFARTCSPFLPLRVTVTDDAGASFTKYTTVCVEHTQSVGAFSDYGDEAVTVGVSGPPSQVQATFWHNGVQDYTDAGGGSPASGSASWTFTALDGDPVTMQALLTTSAVDGAVAAADVRTARGAFAHSVVGKNAAVGATAAVARLVCCGAASPSVDPALAQTVSFVVAPSQLGPIVGGVFPPPVSFHVHYKVANGTTRQTITEFSGTGTSLTRYDVQAYPGDQLAIEASPDAAATWVEVVLEYGGQNGSELASAGSMLAGSPATLNVICCAKLR